MTSARQNKQLISLFILANILIGLWFFLSGNIKGVFVVGAISAVLCWILALVPFVFTPITVLWLGLGHLLAKITNPFFSGILFYLVITPVAMIRKTILLLFKLDNRWNEKAKWEKRKQQKHDKQYFENQF